jgi:hypothetical protein
VAAFCLQGCSKKEKQNSSNPANDKSSEPRTSRAEYTNDLDRLGQLTERINRACRGSHVVVLGAAGTNPTGGVVSVDYASVDRLSDDAAAVMIAEAIVSNSKTATDVHTHANMAKVMLETDETVGRYVARAGLSSAGFAEWLEARKVLAPNLQQNSPPDSTRTAAFMRGYSSEGYSKAR